MHHIQTLALHLGQVLGRYGGWGLFAINVLDSSILPIPVINDLLLIHLASRHPDLAMAYAVQCAAGSMLGSFAIYGLARWAEHLLWRRPSSDDTRRARRWLERNDFVATLVASLLPPPTPFKLVPIAAGAMQMSAVRFGVALLLGRGFRFAVEAFIGMRYGAEAENYLKYHVAFLSITTAAAVVVITVIYRRLQPQPQATSEGNSKSEA